MAKALITGINGFVGPFLALELAQHGRTIYGFDCAAQAGLSGVTYRSLDMQDYHALSRFLDEVKPDEIYHLAGISSPPQADASPREALAVNIMGSVCLLDAMRSKESSAKILMVGSVKEYGRLQLSAIGENQALTPDDFYGISKYTAEMIGGQFINRYNLDIRFTRSFNHTGPGQSPAFVCSDWARQVAQISAGKQPPEIHVGAIDSAIDFTDVRDVVRAYRLIMEKGEKGQAYNVCSGKPKSLEEILQYLLKKAALPIRIVSDPDKVRKTNTSLGSAGSFLKLQRQTGWEPAIDLYTSLDDLYNDWVAQIAKKNNL